MAARVRPTDGEPVTRLKQASLWSPTRLAILEAVHAAPGSSLSELARRIGRHPSTPATELRLLAQAGLVRLERDGRRVRAFPVAGLTARGRLLARLGPSADVFAAIERGTPGRPVPIAHACAISRHAARSHLARLARMGVVRAREVRVLVTERRLVINEEATSEASARERSESEVLRSRSAEADA